MKINKIGKVLIALDYDDISIKVAEVGFSIAQSMNAETILLHVVSERPVYYSSYNLIHELHVDTKGDLRVSIHQYLNKVKKQLGCESIKTVLKEGEVADIILDTAEGMDVDLIVMGSHSRKWMENIIMGSQAQQVLKDTLIPLYIVPTRKHIE